MTPSDIIDGALGFFFKGFFWPFSDQGFWDTPITTLTATALVFMALVFVAYYPVLAVLKFGAGAVNFFIREENKKITDFEIEEFAGLPAIILVILLYLVVGSLQ